MEKANEESTVASVLAKALGKTGKARALDKPEKDVRRWMEVLAGTVEARALQQIARSRVNNKRVVSGPYAAYKLQKRMRTFPTCF